MPIAQILTFMTELGDQAVILPFAATVAIALAAAGARREALLWCVAIFVPLFATLVAKIVFVPCGHLLPGLGIRSPSGHAAAAIAAYGGFAVLWAKFADDRRLQALFISTAFLASIGVAVSRVYLGAHSLSEVLIGSAIGLSAPALLWRMGPPADALSPRPRLVFLLLLLPLALAFLLRGRTLSVEGHIAAFAIRLMSALGVCG